MFVKICGITNEDDALFAVAMGADAVGFIFAPSPRQIAPQQVYDITRRLPPEILTVGVFRDELPSRVVEIAHRAGVKAVQLHGRETPEQTAEVANSIRWVIKAFSATSPELRKADRYGTDLVLVDAPAPGSGKLFDWGLASDVPPSLRADPRRRARPRQRRRRDQGRRAVGGRRGERRRGRSPASRTRPRSAASSSTPAPPRRSRTSGPTSCRTTGPTNDASESAAIRRRLADDRARRHRPLR